MTRPARVLGWLALGFALASGVCVCGLVGFKFGWLSWPVAHFLIYRAAQPLALFSVVLGLVAAVMAGVGRQRSLFLMSLGASALAIAIYLSVSMQVSADSRFPPIHDVSTTWTDPPSPDAALVAERGPKALPVVSAPMVPPDAAVYGGKPVAEVNARTCPAAVPVTLTTTPDKAYPLALKAVKDRGLQLVTDDPAHGVIEATSTNFWNMKEDVMVRVRAEGAGSRIDIRSISRQGANDRGHNCRRVTQLRAALTPGA